MPELRRVSGQEATQALERPGFEQVRQPGSHVILRRQTPRATLGVWCRFIARWPLVHYG